MAHRVEHDPLTQRPLADGELVEVEHVHRGREDQGPGDDEVDAAGVEAVHAEPLGRGRGHEVLVQGQELAAVDGELVQRGRRVLDSPGRHHLGQ